ncbi:MAG: TIGR02452 family protein [Treponema sp.]|nr:TIGR02452 family protein [Treponema sp.]
MSREENIAVFEDTVDMVMNSPRLRDAVRKGRSCQLFIAEKACVPDGSVSGRFNEPAKIVVSKKRTFEAARSYVDGCNRVCVLNFASSTNPGGGVETGAGAQEECLCRVSTLYFTLDTDENQKRFYKPHRALKNPLHNDDILYTPDVCVFKSDTAHSAALPEAEWYLVDVLTCAAPNLRSRPSNRYNSGDGDEPLLLSDDELRTLHEKRDRRIFDVAVRQQADVLVLGAFGCGAFRNSPQVVASVLMNLSRQYRHAFKVIEFAVYCPPFDDTNYRVFMEALSALEAE